MFRGAWKCLVDWTERFVLTREFLRPGFDCILLDLWISETLLQAKGH